MLGTGNRSVRTTGLPPFIDGSNFLGFYPCDGVIGRDLGDFVTTTNKHTRGIDGVLPAVDNANAWDLAL
jgi:hypothetical protein